ncbi:MAG: ArsR family transcriptional regulator [Acidobacteria bacterium]|nr:MAG: ArsR family transcriptional regulator [Acidobacteriota bacterium]
MKRQEYVIRDKRQVAALRSAARQEVVDVLAEMGEVSVAEIAATLGRPADALYFHLRALQRAGLVEAAGYRKRGGRTEALFRTVASELFLHYEPQDEANRRGVTAIVSSMLRLGIRDFGRAFQSNKLIVEGPQRELWALRKTGRLSLTQIAGVNRAIKRLTKSVSKPQGRGRLYGITVLLTPLDHRQRESKRSAKSREKRKQ